MLNRLIAGLQEQGLVEESAPPAPPTRPPNFHGGGGSPHNDPMEARIVKLEDFAQETRERLTRIETKLDQSATKADLSEAMNGMVKWVVGTAVGLGVAGITVMTFVLNNAAPKAPAAPLAQTAPIIINVPGATPAPVAPATPLK